jgi:hypothetical protein
MYAWGGMPSSFVGLGWDMSIHISKHIDILRETC